MSTLLIQEYRRSYRNVLGDRVLKHIIDESRAGYKKTGTSPVKIKDTFNQLLCEMLKMEAFAKTKNIENTNVKKMMYKILLEINMNLILKKE